MQTLPAYLAHLRVHGYSESTTQKYFSDVRKFARLIKAKKIGEITLHDIEQWIAGLLARNGKKLG